MQDNLHYIHYVIVVNLYSSRVKALLLQRMMIKDDVLADCNLYLPIVCLVKLLSGVRKYLTHWTQRPIFYPKSQFILKFFVKIKVEVWTLISGKFEACNNSNWIFGLNCAVCNKLCATEGSLRILYSSWIFIFSSE